MDAEERLRLYLEQRRDLGESDLVLDHLPVADVLALLGVRAGAARKAAPKRVMESPAADAVEAEGPAVPAEPAREVVPPPSPTPRFDPAAAQDKDWRTTLRESGAAGTPPGATPPAASAASTSAGPASSSSAPPASPPAGSPTDAPAWLTALGVPFGVTVGAVRTPAAPGTAGLPASLADIANAVATCTACPLHATATNPVPGEGNPDADFMCVGEAPGQTEDETGRPFVGAAGQLLTKILGAISLSREDVFICNVLKHRPPGNRNPMPDEVQACRPFLEQQLALVRPRVILALGSFAARTLLDTTQSLGALRGRIHRYHGVPVIVTYHPAALLRNEAWKRPTWEDVQLARRIHDAAREASSA